MKKCKYCKKPFKPTFSTTQVVCGIKCSIELDKTKIKKWIDKEKTKEQKEALLSKGHYVQILQALVNKIVRELDKDKPCISCGKVKVKQWDAGHFYPISTHGYLRFDLFNIYKQCSHCNNYLGGNLYQYSKALKCNGVLEIIEEHKEKYNGLRFTIPELKEAIKAAKSALKNLTDRETINKQLNLYR